LTPGNGGDVAMKLGLIESDGRGEFGGITSRDLRYSHLWGWLCALSLILEEVLKSIQKITGSSWGLSVILLSVLIKVALIPVSIFVSRQQRWVGRIQSALEQPLRDIKASYDGQEAHERIMAAHKKLGVSPFYTLRPMLGMLIQVPILIAVFNMLGELPQLSGQAFWWISDLAYPDAVLKFSDAGSGVPLFGSTLNLLPILMTVVTIASAIIYRNNIAPAAETRKQKRNLYFMAIGFLVLFYPFPASMVLYWASTNVLQLAEQIPGKK
jgi:YidC/Oxa1 family membrane protein insertase